MPGKKTILLLHPASCISGAEVSLQLLVRNLAREKYRVVVLLPRKEGMLHQQLRRDGVPVGKLPLCRFKKTCNPLTLAGYLLHILIACIGLLYYMVRYRAALVHANTTNAMLYAAIPCRLAFVPCIWHIRDLLPRAFPARLFAGCSSHIFCISAAVVPAALYGHPKVQLLSNAGDPVAVGTRMHTTLRQQYGIPQDVLLVAQVGQLIPWKNHADLIKAAAQVIREYSKVRFLIIGNDLFDEYAGYRQALEKLIGEKSLSSYFIFTGYRQDMNLVYDEIDILVHPATREPFGRVIIEAMAYARPVVAVDACGPSEIIRHGDTGLLVKPGDTGLLANALVSLLESEDLRSSIGNAAKRFVKGKYSVRRQAAAVDDVYDQLLCV